jgi:hypothetical protein
VNTVATKNIQPYYRPIDWRLLTDCELTNWNTRCCLSTFRLPNANIVRAAEPNNDDSDDDN